MKNKNTISIALVLTIAVTALAFGSRTPITNGLFNFSPKAHAQSTSQIPSHILYDQVFRLTDSFRRKAESQTINVEEVTAFAHYFKEKAQLTDPENEILLQVTANFMQEVQPLDDQAETLIEDLRKSFPDGSYIEPPSELRSLQEQRNNAALLYRDQLNQLLGNVRFSEFDNFVQGDFSSGIQVISIPPQ